MCVLAPHFIARTHDAWTKRNDSRLKTKHSSLELIRKESYRCDESMSSGRRKSDGESRQRKLHEQIIDNYIELLLWTTHVSVCAIFISIFQECVKNEANGWARLHHHHGNWLKEAHCDFSSRFLLIKCYTYTLALAGIERRSRTLSKPKVNIIKSAA